MKLQRKIFMAIFCLFLVFLIHHKGIADDKKSAYQFTIDYEVNRTPVKSQGKTGTCWCFATTSFIESELLRLGKGEFDLSEMFVVRHTYPRKAQNYVRLHGNATFGEGSLSHDVFNTVTRFGTVPEQLYPGMLIDEKRHNHGEMFAVLKALLDAVLKVKGKLVTPKWTDAFESILDAYLGNSPENFTYKGKQYTPISFFNQVINLTLNNYIEFTSFTHHPFYDNIRLEVPDNWSYHNQYINIPIDDMEEIVDHALKNGHSVVWDGDISEKEYATFKTGYAIVPEKNWDEKTPEQREQEITEPVAEKEITQELRQKTFDNFSTTDDHLMHIVGIAHDQNGTKFYLAKDSWDTDGRYRGYIYLSRCYFRLKTIAIMLNKEALPLDMRQQLKL